MSSRWAENRRPCAELSPTCLVARWMARRAAMDRAGFPSGAPESPVRASGGYGPMCRGPGIAPDRVRGRIRTLFAGGRRLPHRACFRVVGVALDVGYQRLEVFLTPPRAVLHFPGRAAVRRALLAGGYPGAHSATQRSSPPESARAVRGSEFTVRVVRAAAHKHSLGCINFRRRTTIM